MAIAEGMMIHLVHPLQAVASAIGAPPPGPELLFALAVLLGLAELSRIGIR